MSYYAKPVSEPAVNDPDWELVRRNPTFCGGFPDLDLIVAAKDDKYTRAMIESQIGADYEIMTPEIEPEVRVTERGKGKGKSAENTKESQEKTAEEATNLIKKSIANDASQLLIPLHELRTTRIPKGRTWYERVEGRLLTKQEVETVSNAIVTRAAEKVLRTQDGSEEYKKCMKEYAWQKGQFAQWGAVNGMMYDLD